MWQDASAQFLGRTLAVVSLETADSAVEGEGVAYTFPEGSGFIISTDPILILTNHHVVTDTDGNELEHLRVGPLGGTPAYKPVEEICKNERIDLAVLAISGTMSEEPVTFWTGNPLSMGTPVASLGCSVPQWKEHEERTELWQITKRLSTGHVSQAEFPLIQEDGEPFPVPVYELNAAIYGGASGGPCFNRDGQVVGVLKGSLQVRSELVDETEGKQTQDEDEPEGKQEQSYLEEISVFSRAAYSRAIRSDHVVEALESLGVSYKMTDGD